MEAEIKIVIGRGHAKYGILTQTPFDGLEGSLERINDFKMNSYHLYDGLLPEGSIIWAKQTLGKNGKIYWSNTARPKEIPEEIHIQTEPDNDDGDFKNEIRRLINMYSKENESNTPDFVLANYMMDSLMAFEKAVISRDSWNSND